MRLTQLLERFSLDRQVSRNYRSGLLRTVRRATAYGLSEVCQLTDATVNEFLCSLTEYAAETRANVRRELCTLWRYAHEIELTDTLPTRVRRIKIARKPAQAWSMDELARMVQCAREDETAIGSKHQARVCDLLPAWILTGYETGLRFTDILTLTQDRLRRSMLCVTEGKTAKAATFCLSDECVGELDRLAHLSTDNTYWTWALTRRRAFLVWRAFLDRHSFGGTSRWLRRSAATYIEIDRAGEATRFLRHSAPHLAQIHYIDSSLLPPPVAPPRLRVG